MKKALLLFFIIIAGTASAQTIKAKYTTTHLKTFVNSSHPDSLNAPPQTKAAKLKPSVYNYVYYDGKSLTTLISGEGYTKKTKIDSDSGNIITDENKMPSEELFYKDIPAKILRMEVTSGTENYSYKIDFKDFKWDITNETTTLLNYKCTKAIGTLGKYTVTAWFANDIKISDGPTIFYSLPGLILKANMNGMYEIVANSIELSKEKITIAEPAAKAQIQTF